MTFDKIRDNVRQYNQLICLANTFKEQASNRFEYEEAEDTIAWAKKLRDDLLSQYWKEVLPEVAIRVGKEIEKGRL